MENKENENLELENNLETTTPVEGSPKIEKVKLEDIKSEKDNELIEKIMNKILKIN